MKATMGMNGVGLALSLLVGLAAFARPNEARAFRGCEDVRDEARLYRCWPAYGVADRPMDATPAGNGTQKWSFCYTFQDHGLEIHDLAFNGRSVAKKVSMPYVMTRSSQTVNTASSPVCHVPSNQAFDHTPRIADVAADQAEMGCVHVPTTVCTIDERDCQGGTCVNSNMQMCMDPGECAGSPSEGLTLSAGCSGLCTPCKGVCTGSQNGTTLTTEIIDNEENAGGGGADVVLTATTFVANGHQLVQRYRFKDSGTFIPSVRFGGASLLEAHDHIAYWRFELDAPGNAGGNDVIQRCTGTAAQCGGNSAESTPQWASIGGCQCAATNTDPLPHGRWRIYDQTAVMGGAPVQSIVIEGSPNDGAPGICGSTDKTFCALQTNAGINEGLNPAMGTCADGLNDFASDMGNCALAGGAPISFWYLGHASHDPCNAANLEFCEPKRALEAMGPKLTLSGDVWFDSPCPLTGVLTQKNNPRRTGANLEESILTAGNVNVRTTGGGLPNRLDIPVVGQIIAQPLVASITGAGCTQRNILYVVTMANRVYAFDANTGAPIAERPNTSDPICFPPDQRCLDGRPYRLFDADNGGQGPPNPYWGISSTPVIDGPRNILFLVTKTDNSAVDAAIPHQASFHLHALNALTLEDLPGSPFELGEQVIQNLGMPGLTSLFVPAFQDNRPGLLYDHGHIYVAFGALPFDNFKFHGVIFSFTYDGSRFVQVANKMMSRDDAAGAGIWQAGNGPLADTAGNVYFQVGNTSGGTFDATHMLTDGRDFGECAVKVSSGTMSTFRAFTPPDRIALDDADLDLGAGAPLLLPNGSTIDGRLLVLGKQGVMTLHETSNLAPLPTTDTTRQRVRVTFNEHRQIPRLQGFANVREDYPHVHSPPVFWQGPTEARIYTWGEKDVLRGHLYDVATGSFPLVSLGTEILPAAAIPCRVDREMPPGCHDFEFNSNAGCFTTAEAIDALFTTQHVTPDLAQTGSALVNNLCHLGSNGMPGGALSLSAHGSDAGTGIVWASINDLGNSEVQFVRGVLRAYDATPDVNGHLVELWNDFDRPAYYISKFTPPTIWNGRVYQVGNIVVGGFTPLPDPAVAFSPGATSWATNPNQIQGHVFVYSR